MARLRRHPLARAIRVDKLTLAALEATLTGPPTPTALALHADPEALRVRTAAVVAALGDPAELTAAVGSVGGGSGPGVELPGWAISLPVSYAEPLRLGDPAVVGRVEHGRCLIDLRCVPPDADARPHPRGTRVQVIATAGHVDHGKSTLVRALTGMEPDRWAEERRRGMTIDLGYAWTTLPSGEQVAFVDVPGHERFTTNMLAGVGPVPAVLLVVAADEGWAAQTDEHVRALDALRVEHGLLAVTRSDLADPGPATEQTPCTARGHQPRRHPRGERVRHHRRRHRPSCGRRSTTSSRLLPRPDPDARVRLWVDRSFTIKGQRHRGHRDARWRAPSEAATRSNSAGERVSVRALQRLGEPADVVQAPGARRRQPARRAARPGAPRAMRC